MHVLLLFGVEIPPPPVIGPHGAVQEGQQHDENDAGAVVAAD